MVHPVLPIVIALTFGMPKVDLSATSKDPLSCLKSNGSMFILADGHAGDDPHGDDPHGKDVHRERHDDDMPANKYDRNRQDDPGPYGDNVPNTRKPY